MKLLSLRKNVISSFILGALLMAAAGCQVNMVPINRENFSKVLSDICKKKYQANVSCKAAKDTVWIYLSYTPGRKGIAETKENDKDLYLEYQVASFNPYKTIEPPELKFIVQKIISEIRRLLLRCRDPYEFFVLVVTDITPIGPPSPPPMDQWYIGYFNDVKNFSVGADFSGEGYSRLVWHKEPVPKTYTDKNGETWYATSRDTKGEHIDYREVTLKEFVDKQIKWRIYKRFTIEYNKSPFDLTREEKRDEIFKIIQTVLNAYNFNEFETFYLKDSSFLDEAESFTGYSREDIKKYQTRGIIREPAF